MELSRRSFIRGGGALVVGFGLAGAARAAGDPYASNGPDDLGQVDSFIAIHADNTVTVKTGRVELGQGSTTGLLLLVAEELDLDVDQLVTAQHDTNVTPNTGGTFGSSSIAIAGPRLRSAAATARQALLRLASERLGVPAANLTVARGVVTGGGRSVTYGELVGDRVLNVPMAAPGVDPGAAPSKPVAEYRLVGRARTPRVDIPAKVTGAYTYLQSVRVPGMLHGRIVRPRGQGAYGAGTANGVVAVDERSIARIGDARVVRRGDFLGVVASREVDAIEAAARLKVVYRDPPAISGSGNLWHAMGGLDTAGQAPARVMFDAGDVAAALGAAAHQVSATYAYRYQGHMPIGPSCAVADVTDGGAIVLANRQDAYRLRTLLANVLDLPPGRVRVQYWEGAASFGNGPARFDTGVAAAVISQLAGAPVRLQFMRWDEHGWDNYSPAVLADLRGGVDASGRIVALDYTAFGIPEMSMTAGPTTQAVGVPLLPPGLGSASVANSGTQYDIPNRRVTAKSLPVFDTFLKTSALRAPGAPPTTFASEQLVDELAHAAGLDPYLFRLQNVSTARVNDGFGQWRDALVGAARLAGWEPRVAASRVTRGDVAAGRGIAIGGFAGSQVGVVAEIEVSWRTGRITAKRLCAAQVCGLAVYVPGVENQLEGNLIMGASRALHESVAFDTRRVTIVQRPDLAPTGSGEPSQAPIAAALANAFFDATGVRIREAPMTPALVRGVLGAAAA